MVLGTKGPEMGALDVEEGGGERGPPVVEVEDGRGGDLRTWSWGSGLWMGKWVACCWWWC